MTPDQSERCLQFLMAIAGFTSMVGAWTLAMFAVMFTERMLKRRAVK